MSTFSRVNWLYNSVVFLNIFNINFIFSPWTIICSFSIDVILNFPVPNGIWVIIVFSCNIGKHSKYSKKLTGSFRCILNVFKFIFSITSICSTFSLYIEFESLIVFIENSISSIFTASPLCHFLFSFNFIIYVSSSIFDHSSAIHGSTLKSFVIFINGSYISLVICCISRFLVKIGFIVSKFDIPIEISWDICNSLFLACTLFCLLLSFR